MYRLLSTYHMPVEKFYDYWEDDKIKLLQENLSPKLRGKLKTPYSVLTSKQKEKVNRKQRYIEEFDIRKEEKKQKKDIVNHSEIILDIASDFDDNFPPSLRTLMRWKSEYTMSNKNIRSLSDRYGNSGRRSTLNEKQKKLIQESIDNVYLTPEKGTVSQTLEDLKTLGKNLGRKRPSFLHQL